MPTTTFPPAMDADGHLIESFREMAEYAHPAVRALCLNPEQMIFHSPFPTPDGVHWPNPIMYESKHGSMGLGGEEEFQVASKHRKGSAGDWLEFMDRANVDHAVLYPTEGLLVSQLRDNDYAKAVSQAYNNYVSDRYRRVSSKLLPMALIPMQKPADAVTELRRAVRDLKLPGAMLCATGHSLDLGHEFYWPVYEEAANLGCVLGVHGAANIGIGMDSINSMAASHVIHHPIPLMIAATSMVHNGLFERYSDLRVAFVEGGCGWTTVLLDRMARNAEIGAGGWGATRKFEHYLSSGQILIGCEPNEGSLSYLIRRVGADAFAFSTDYPHEVDFKTVLKELETAYAMPEISLDEKNKMLGDNARRFYRLI